MLGLLKEAGEVKDSPISQLYSLDKGFLKLSFLGEKGGEEQGGGSHECHIQRKQNLSVPCTYARTHSQCLVQAQKLNKREDLL